MLGVLLSTIHAILVNPHIFVEPYLHQMMPSILSILLTSSLAEPELLRQINSSSEDVQTPLVTAGPSSFSLRAHASALLTHVVDTFGASYPTLKPRVVATLLKALMTGVVPGSSDQDARTEAGATREPRASTGTKLGALMALRRLGNASFRVLLSHSAQLNARLGDASESEAASTESPLRLLASGCSRGNPARCTPPPTLQTTASSFERFKFDPSSTRLRVHCMLCSHLSSHPMQSCKDRKRRGMRG